MMKIEEKISRFFCLILFKKITTNLGRSDDVGYSEGAATKIVGYCSMRFSNGRFWFGSETQIVGCG